MRLAFVCSSLARYNVEMLRQASSMGGVHVTVIRMVECDRFREWRYSSEGLDVKTIGGIHVPLETRSAGPETYHISSGLLRELRQGGYDVLMTSSWTQGFTLQTLAVGKILRRPVMLFEESIPHKASWWKRLAMPAIRLMMRSYDSYVASSSKCKEYLVSLGCTRERVYVVRHAIDLEAFWQTLTLSEKRLTRHALGLPDEVPVVLFVGQFIKRKGVIELLEAWRQSLAREESRALLVLTGSGELEPSIRQFVAAHDLADTVRVNPYMQHDELKRWYGAADVFAMPSRYDTFGVVAGEAMASGLPVITTSAVGAEPDLVQDGLTGVVIPPEDLRALGHAISRLIKDVQLREQMGARARQSAARYATQDIAAELVQVAKNTVSDYRRRTGTRI
jgi:glycosyltransferase involved in cell wall biosynthesis